MAELMLWLQDMNWPGAFCILDRLKKLKTFSDFQNAYDICLKCAIALDDDVWKENLEMLISF